MISRLHSLPSIIFIFDKRLLASSLLFRDRITRWCWTPVNCFFLLIIQNITISCWPNLCTLIYKLCFALNSTAWINQLTLIHSIKLPKLVPQYTLSSYLAIGYPLRAVDGGFSVYCAPPNSAWSHLSSWKPGGDKLNLSNYTSSIAQNTPSTIFYPLKPAPPHTPWYRICSPSSSTPLKTGQEQLSTTIPFQLDLPVSPINSEDFMPCSVGDSERHLEIRIETEKRIICTFKCACRMLTLISSWSILSFLLTWRKHQRSALGRIHSSLLTQTRPPTLPPRYNWPLHEQGRKGPLAFGLVRYSHSRVRQGPPLTNQPWFIICFQLWKDLCPGSPQEERKCLVKGYYCNKSWYLFFTHQRSVERRQRKFWQEWWFTCLNRPRALSSATEALLLLDTPLFCASFTSARTPCWLTDSRENNSTKCWRGSYQKKSVCFCSFVFVFVFFPHRIYRGNSRGVENLGSIGDGIFCLVIFMGCLLHSQHLPLSPFFFCIFFPSCQLWSRAPFLWIVVPGIPSPFAQVYSLPPCSTTT